jgi:hypothetical protein
MARRSAQKTAFAVVRLATTTDMRIDTQLLTFNYLRTKRRYYRYKVPLFGGGSPSGKVSLESSRNSKVANPKWGRSPQGPINGSPSKVQKSQKVEILGVFRPQHFFPSRRVARLYNGTCRGSSATTPFLNILEIICLHLTSKVSGIATAISANT